jgi:hypothetical protein
MHIIPYNLLSDKRMWAHPCCTHIPPGQELVPQEEAHAGCCDEFVSGLGRRLPVNFGCWIIVFVWCNYLTILYRTPLYIKDVAFISISWVIICVRLDPSTYLIGARVWTPKSGCNRSGIRGMLIVGRNLDRTGQPLPTYLATLILSKLFLIFSHLLLLYSDYSYLFTSKDKSGFHTLKSCT